MTDEDAINLSFRDKFKRWRDGEPCIEVIAEFADKNPDMHIGHMVYHRKDDRTTYSGLDVAGNEVFSETPSLPYAKLQFHRQRLKLLNLAKEYQEERELDPIQSRGRNAEAIPSPYAVESQKPKEKKRDRSIKRTPNAKGKSKGNSRNR